MILLVVAVLALALGWTWGHSTARIRVIPIGATAAEDEDALAFDEACCETWLVSRGAEHDDQCVIARWAA